MHVGAEILVAHLQEVQVRRSGRHGLKRADPRCRCLSELRPWVRVITGLAGGRHLRPQAERNGAPVPDYVNEARGGECCP